MNTENLIKQKNRRYERTSSLPVILMITWLLFLISCDNYHTESLSKNNQPSFTVVQDNILVTPTTSNYIDLNSLITGTGIGKIEIGQRPSSGVLYPVSGTSLLGYAKDPLVLNGSDLFTISVYSMNNQLLKDVPIKMTISDNIDEYGSGSFAVDARNDYVYNVSGSVDIDVLKNDSVYNVTKSDLILELPDSAFLRHLNGLDNPGTKGSANNPLFGSLEVLANKKIRYIPNSSYTGRDKFIYLLRKPKNVPTADAPETFSMAIVYIGSEPSCENSLKLVSDTFQINLTTTPPNSKVLLDVSSNDALCMHALNTFVWGFATFPKGSLYYADNGYNFDYIIPADAKPGNTDTFKYYVQIDYYIREAQVMINFK